MSFTAFSEEPIATLIGEAGSAERVTLIIGAGASMEAGLPSWEGLIRRLLVRVADREALIDTTQPDQVKRWQEACLGDGFLAGAALIDAYAGGARDDWITDELFGPQGPSAYRPGPIAAQLPDLRRAFGEGLELLTLNYDDLIEEAFRADDEFIVHTLVDGTEIVAAPAERNVTVNHLHGYLGRDGLPTGRIILSEADYQTMQAGETWQEKVVRRALERSTVIFVGTSLIDSNLIRYLHAARESSGPEAFAVFVRQGTYDADVPARIPEARERAQTRRWGELGVTPVFVNHYTDVAQLLYEITHRRETGKDDYVPLPDRARDWHATVDQGLLGADDPGRFVAGQHLLNGFLRRALALAEKAAGDAEGKPWDEKLGLTLWLTNEDGTTVTNCATTDRVHVDPETVEPVPINEHSHWVAVRAYCHGRARAEPRDQYASRWHYVRGLPLTVKDERFGRIPVGCLTATSMLRRDETRLNAMEDDVEAAFNTTLRDSVLAILTAATEPR